MLRTARNCPISLALKLERIPIGRYVFIEIWLKITLRGLNREAVNNCYDVYRWLLCQIALRTCV